MDSQSSDIWGGRKVSVQSISQHTAETLASGALEVRERTQRSGRPNARLPGLIFGDPRSPPHASTLRPAGCPGRAVMVPGNPVGPRSRSPGRRLRRDRRIGRALWVEVQVVLELPAPATLEVRPRRAVRTLEGVAVPPDYASDVLHQAPPTVQAALFACEALSSRPPGATAAPPRGSVSTTVLSVR